MSPQQSTNQLQNYLSMPEVQAVLKDIAQPEGDVQQWLASLLLLKNIPFQNIVPDTGLVPAESLKFFYIDFSWIDALMDGALSVGRNGGSCKRRQHGSRAAVKAGIAGERSGNYIQYLDRPITTHGWSYFQVSHSVRLARNAYRSNPERRRVGSHAV